MIPPSKIPEGPLNEKWNRYKQTVRTVPPEKKKEIEIIIVGTGLAGASAAAALGEQGYRVKVFCLQDSPRRAHSVAAQGGINAAKNYKNDGDSIERLFSDTIRGGDYRSREANVYRLAEISNAIIDHCVAQGVPFAREYSGLLDNRSFGGTKVARTFYARGQTGQQLLLGAYGAMSRQINRGTVTLYTRNEMLDLVVADGKARGIITRNLITGAIEKHVANAVVIATGGYGNVYGLSTNAMSSNASAIWQCYKKGALFANPCFVQIHPTCIPPQGDYQSKLTLMSESIRNDGRMWVPKDITTAEKLRRKEIKPEDVKEEDRDYFLERRYPSYGNLVPRDIASRAVKERCDAGLGIGPTGLAVYLDLTGAIKKIGKKVIEERYGNLTEMYKKITGDDPCQTAMMIYPAVHYTMGGLWADYELMTSIPGLFAIGEANFSDHGANRLGASALMQGLADGYFILPLTIQNYLHDEINTNVCSVNYPEFSDAEKNIHEKIYRLMSVKGNRSVNTFHKQLGSIMWNLVGMTRNKKDLSLAIREIKTLRDAFYKTVIIPGTASSMNPELEKALRVSDYLELSELIAFDALTREESCGCHFREEHQTEDGEAKRNDIDFNHVSCWKYMGADNNSTLYKEKLVFENIDIKIRDYK